MRCRNSTASAGSIKQAPVGSIFEWRNDTARFDIARRVRDPGRGPDHRLRPCRSDVGETLQSVNEHAFADPLSAPGLADITAHVDFQIFGRCGGKHRGAVQGPVTQGHFLSELGIGARAEALRKGASGEQAATSPLRSCADRIRPHRHGRIVQGDCDLRSEARTASGAAIDMMLQAKSLGRLEGIRHAFFTREGGVSGASIQASTAASARRTMRNPSPKTAPAWRALWMSRPTISSAVTRSTSPDAGDRRPSHGRRPIDPRADAIVTKMPGLAIGVDSRLRAAAFRRRESGRDRCGTCRLARRFYWCDRSHRRRHGESSAPKEARIACGARPADPPAKL